jgi:hypothetical protein
MSSSIDDSFPTPGPEDSDDVELALETAAALWGKGDRPEALRWLRRGAEAAGQAGNDQRALDLARRAAELDSLPSPVAEEERRPEPAPEPEGEIEAEVEAEAGAEIEVEAGAETEVEAETEIEAEPPPSVAAPPPARPTLPAVPSKAPEPHSVRLSQAPPKPAQRASVVPDQAQRPIEPASRREPIRVYVKTSARDQSLLIVRPLENGRKAPFGTKEATLVFDESN